LFVLQQNEGHRNVADTPHRRTHTILALTLLIALLAPNAALAAPPAQELVSITGLNRPTAIEFLPNGTVLVAEDGYAPRVFARVTPRFGTPHWALTAAAVALMVIFHVFITSRKAV
jgi:amino acid transporter